MVGMTADAGVETSRVNRALIVNLAKFVALG